MTTKKQDKKKKTRTSSQNTQKRAAQDSKTAVSHPNISLQRAVQTPQALSPTDARNIQRTIGNQAGRRLVIQRKMTLGPVGDKYEQEADNVAKQVVNRLAAQPTPEQTGKNITQRQEEEEEIQASPLAISSLQRQEGEEEVQAKPLAIGSLQRQEEEEEIQAKRDPMLAGGELSSDVETAVTQAKSGGQPLGSHVRRPMEQAFGADFSHTKIHTDSTAHHLNRSLSARAFTSGQDVFFRQGEYQPDTSQGQELIAHELTHVVQQTGPVIRRGIKKGDDLPEMDSMTRQHMKDKYDLGTEQKTRTDAISDFIATNELIHAQKHIKSVLFMLTIFQKFNSDNSHEGDSFAFVSQFMNIAKPLMAVAKDMTEAKNTVIKTAVKTNPEYARLGAMFFAETSKFTSERAKERAPEARDEKEMAQQFLQGRANVKFVSKLTKKKDRKAFTTALKSMATVQLLLNPPQKGLSGMGQGWKDGGSVSANIAMEAPAQGRPMIQTNIMNGKIIDSLDTANDFIKFIVEPQLLRELNKPEIHIHPDYSAGPRHPKGFRAFQNGNTVHVAQDEDVAVIVHEIGHYLENNLPTETWHDIRLLIEERHKAKGGGDKAVRGANRSKKEGRYKGDYAATGKYTSRAYAGGATEVMSMTLQYLATKGNAKKMVEKDPQQAAIILRGVRPKEYASTTELRPFDQYLPN